MGVLCVCVCVDGERRRRGLIGVILASDGASGVCCCTCTVKQTLRSNGTEVHNHLVPSRPSTLLVSLMPLPFICPGRPSVVLRLAYPARRFVHSNISREFLAEGNDGCRVLIYCSSSSSTIRDIQTPQTQRARYQSQSPHAGQDQT